MNSEPLLVRFVLFAASAKSQFCRNVRSRRTGYILFFVHWNIENYYWKLLGLVPFSRPILFFCSPSACVSAHSVSILSLLLSKFRSIFFLCLLFVLWFVRSFHRCFFLFCHLSNSHNQSNCTNLCGSLNSNMSYDLDNLITYGNWYQTESHTVSIYYFY